jgi:serine/threonine protein kinase
MSMSFQPNPGDEVVINDIAYTIGQHPAAPGLAYAQAGRQGIVYQLIPRGDSIHGAKALKVFFPKFRIPAMVYQSEHMEPYSELPGLKVCKREVLTPERNGALIGEHPDLLYAVLMPWVQGLTWFDVISDQKQLTAEESLQLARALAGTGSAMEQRGLAHCDMSAPNVMIPFFSEVQNSDLNSAVELVDVEQMYGSKMDRPDALLAGSPGYAAHRTVHSGLWSSYADRFAGAVIIAEMLCWSDPAIVEKAWGESYFDQHEMQTMSERYFAMRGSLENRWGSKLSDLFIRAWESHDLSSCPTFGEWYIALAAADIQQAEAFLAALAEPDENVTDSSESDAIATPKESDESKVVKQDAAAVHTLNSKQSRDQEAVVNRLFLQARALEDEDKPSAALEVYRSLYHFIPDNSAMQMEVEAAIKELDEKMNAKTESTEPVPIPFYRSRKFMISSAVLIVLLAGGVPTVKILADQSEVKQQEAARLAEAKAAQDAAAAKLKQEEAEKQKAAKLEAEEKKKLAEAKKKEAETKKKEEERKALQAKYEKQAKYEAYLAKQEQQKKEAAQKALQAKYDQQAKYEAYLVWKKENDAKIAKQKAAAEAKRKQELAQKEALKKKRAQNVVTLIANYNKAYNAQKGRKTDNALAYARDFKNLYNTDASYFKGVGKVAARMSAINKFLSNSKYSLPDL